MHPFSTQNNMYVDMYRHILLRKICTKDQMLFGARSYYDMELS